MTRFVFGMIGLLSLAASAIAADLTAYPGQVVLAGPRAVQQLVVADVTDGRAVADHTADAAFTSDHPDIAIVSETGRVSAVGDGSATITATVSGRTTTIPVTVSGTGTSTPPSFRHQVLPTLTRTGCNSGACHGALAGKGGFKLSLRAYDPEADHFALTRQALARRVDTAAPDDSLVLLKATRVLRHGGGTRFDEDSDHYRLLREWIAAGAVGPTPSDPTLERVEVFPPAALLGPGKSLHLIVLATYSDGRTEDVTRWAKFTSSEEQVATAGADGVVSVIGHGEAGVAAMFGTEVAVATVTSPFPDPEGGRSESGRRQSAEDEGKGNNPLGRLTSAALGTAAHDSSFVDELILAKLKLLNLPPSPPCTDAEFIRRASLDACGVLPTPKEVDAFLEDTAADKRATLVDRLLDRPEYVDYWTHKWSDLLLVSSRSLPAPAMWSFYQSVRRSVSANQSWDEFARGILTASGSTLDDGGGNYFVLHKDVSDLAESTAVTFLGMSINCARCHNHPLEKWTQDQYWAFANLFSRVALKDTGRAGEVVVRSTPTGEAFHLRRGTPMPPAPLDGLALPLDSSTDRREYFADWLTAPDNPFFARSLVNRVWRNYMGRGLVEAEDDMRATNPATNPELLAALTDDFVDHGFDVKHLMRTIMTSAAYQRSARPLPGNRADDRFYSRYLGRRLPAEVLLDAYSDVTDVPTPFDEITVGSSGGTKKDASYPAGVRAVQLPDSQLVSRFLDAFGRAERSQTCACERTDDATVTQALHLSNGDTLNAKLRDANSRPARWLVDGKSDTEIVDGLFRLALSRPPNAGERKRFVSALADASKVGPDARREAIEDAFWAVLTGKEFLFNH